MLRECPLTRYVFHILICNNELTALTHSERVSMFSLSRFYEFKLTIFRPLSSTTRREVLLITLRSAVITWPGGLHMNGELAQMQIEVSVPSPNQKSEGHVLCVRGIEFDYVSTSFLFEFGIVPICFYIYCFLFY